MWPIPCSSRRGKLDIEHVDLIVPAYGFAVGSEEEGPVGGAALPGLHSERADVQPDAQLARQMQKWGTPRLVLGRNLLEKARGVRFHNKRVFRGLHIVASRAAASRMKASACRKLSSTFLPVRI